MKMMKKVMFLFLLFLLSGCNVTEEEIPAIVEDEIAPNIYGVVDEEILKGGSFDPLKDVSVYDVQDGYITDSLTIEGEVDEDEIGMYLLKYRVLDSDNNQKLLFRYITVNRDASVLHTENIFEHGRFTDGLTGFDIYQEEGKGYADFDVVDGVLEIELRSVESGVWYRPRLNAKGLVFEEGEVYRIEFYAKADDNRLIQLQAGELINYDPWFIKFDPNANIFEVTEQWTLFYYEFTMGHDTNYNGTVLFEFGDIQGDNSLTTIYLDNVKVLKYK